MRNYLALSAVGLLVLLSGCASEPEVLPASPHVATTPEHVFIYEKRPARYEQLGTIKLEITQDMAWDEKGEANKAFALLLQKAAAMGANGLVLWAPEGETDILAVAGYKGTFYKVPLKRELPKRIAVAQAVYVIK